MQVSSWWSLFSRCLQGLELLSGFEHYANVTLLTASVFFSEQIDRLHHFPEHTRLCSGQAQQCEADQPREDHGQPEQGARTCGGRDQTSYSAWRWNQEVQSRFAMTITENRISFNDAWKIMIFISYFQLLDLLMTPPWPAWSQQLQLHWSKYEAIFLFYNIYLAKKIELYTFCSLLLPLVANDTKLLFQAIAALPPPQIENGDSAVIAEGECCKNNGCKVSLGEIDWKSLS